MVNWLSKKKKKNGELIKKSSDIGVRIGSLDHQSLKGEICTIPLIRDMVYTSNFVFSFNWWVDI